MPIVRVGAEALRVLDAAPVAGIHSVFDSAVNLRAGERLLVCTARAISAPHSVELTTGDLLWLRDHGRRRPGAALRWDRSRRRLTDPAGGLAVAASPRLAVFDAVLPAGDLPRPDDAIAPLLQLLTRLRPPSGFGDDWPALGMDGRFDDAVASIIDGRVDSPVLHWLGRGPGLTPSGDDVLVGAIATLWGAGSLAAGPLTALRASLEHAALRRTTRISAEYLYYACRGMVAGPLRELILGLRRADHPAVAGSVHRLRNYGHTSGIDSILGVIAAARSGAARGLPSAGADPDRARRAF